MMVRTFLLLWLVVQLSRRGIKGDYQVLVTVHSLVLLESRCAECYGKVGESIQRDLCCDGNNKSSCPDSCDILLGFCRLSHLLPSDKTSDRLFGTTCTQSTELSYATDLLGNNFKPNEIHQFSDIGSLGGTFRSLSNPVVYHEVGKWEGTQLNISVVDRDFSMNMSDFEDLIDHFSIPITISAGSSVNNNFTGRYNYVRLELTIEVRCNASNTDESCVCLPGFNGEFCDNINDCNGVTCNNQGQCVDRVQNFSCDCEPGYTGVMCESKMASGTSTVIIGGVVGGVLFLLMLVIFILVLALLVFRQRRTKIFDVQGSSKTGFDSSKVVLQSGDVHMYDETAGNGARKTGTSGSETLKEFKNPIYGDDPELEHEYETTDKAYSGSKDHSDQYQELERKFENPIYGDEDDGNSSNPIPPHESNIDYDQVGNVYHTLESEQDRQQRYAEAGKAAAAAIAASVEVKDSSKGQTGKPQHSYEDVQ